MCDGFNMLWIEPNDTYFLSEVIQVAFHKTVNFYTILQTIFFQKTTRLRGVSFYLYIAYSEHNNVKFWGVCDYRRGMDWILDLLITCVHHSELHFIVHWHTETSDLSLSQSPLAVSWQQI
jgi:hypothetical protein